MVKNKGAPLEILCFVVGFPITLLAHAGTYVLSVVKTTDGESSNARRVNGAVQKMQLLQDQLQTRIERADEEKNDHTETAKSLLRIGDKQGAAMAFRRAKHMSAQSDRYTEQLRVTEINRQNLEQAMTTEEIVHTQKAMANALKKSKYHTMASDAEQASDVIVDSMADVEDAQEAIADVGRAMPGWGQGGGDDDDAQLLLELEDLTLDSELQGLDKMSSSDINAVSFPDVPSGLSTVAQVRHDEDNNDSHDEKRALLANQ